MKWLKKFESEIDVGTWKHLNPLKASSQIVVEPRPLFHWKCLECKFTFSTPDPQQGWCTVCLAPHPERDFFVN